MTRTWSLNAADKVLTPAVSPSPVSSIQVLEVIVLAADGPVLAGKLTTGANDGHPNVTVRC